MAAGELEGGEEAGEEEEGRDARPVNADDPGGDEQGAGDGEEEGVDEAGVELWCVMRDARCVMWGRCGWLGNSGVGTGRLFGSRGQLLASRSSATLSANWSGFSS